MQGALVWDLDGTLAETWQDLAKALNQAYADFGVPPAPAQTIKTWIGDGAEQMVVQGLPEALRAPARLAEVVGRFRAYYVDCCIEQTRLYPGVRAVLTALRGLPMAVASNKPERFVRQIVAGLEIEVYFEVLAGGDTVGVRKPDPRVLRWVAERLALPPTALVMIGDTPTDVRAARAVGARSLSVTWGYRSRAELVAAAAEVLVERVEEIPAIVAQL